MIENQVLEKTNKKIYGESIDMQIDVSDSHKIWKMNIDIYSNPFRFITELVSNAYDATVERAIELGIDTDTFVSQNPIIIELTDDNLLKIRETHGIGISPKRMDEIFKFLNKTTKDKSSKYIGCKGKGRLSSLAYTETVYYNTVHDNKLYSYTLTKYNTRINNFNEEETIISPRIVLNDTVDYIYNNYTEVVIPIKSHDITDLFRTIEEQLLYFNNVVYSFKNYKTKEDYLNNIKLFHYDNFVIAYHPKGFNNNSPQVLLEKVPYPINTDYIDTKFLGCKIGIKLGTSSLRVNESREQLIYGNVWMYYDINGNLVENIEDAYTNNTLKQGYIRKETSVIELVQNKVDATCDELISLLKSQSTSTDCIIKYTNENHINDLLLKDGVSKLDISEDTYRSHGLKILTYSNPHNLTNYDVSNWYIRELFVDALNGKTIISYDYYTKDYIFVDNKRKDFTKNRYIEQQYPNHSLIKLKREYVDNTTDLQDVIIEDMRQRCIIYDDIVVPNTFRVVKSTSTVKRDNSLIHVGNHGNGNYYPTFNNKSVSDVKDMINNETVVFYYLKNEHIHYEVAKFISTNFKLLCISNTVLKKIKSNNLKHVTDYKNYIDDNTVSVLYKDIKISNILHYKERLIRNARYGYSIESTTSKIINEHIGCRSYSSGVAQHVLKFIGKQYSNISDKDKRYYKALFETCGKAYNKFESIRDISKLNKILTL